MCQLNSILSLEKQKDVNLLLVSMELHVYLQMWLHNFIATRMATCMTTCTYMATCVSVIAGRYVAGGTNTLPCLAVGL